MHPFIIFYALKLSLVLFCQTRILVTHGLSFLPQVDQIVVLQDGKISEVRSMLLILSNYKTQSSVQKLASYFDSHPKNYFLHVPLEKT